MIFLNKTTNVKWEIWDREHQRRLLNDKNYEVIENIEPSPTLDLDTLSYKELQEMAKGKGLQYMKIKKEDLIKSLKVGE